MKIYKFFTVLVLGAMLLISTSAMASPFTVLVGDKDGYGFGASDNGIAVWPVTPFYYSQWYDGRSSAEQAATNGAQITDCYSSLFPGYGPNNSTASVIFPLPQAIVSATLTVAMGDFTATLAGPIAVDYNGISENWAFDDGYQVTKVRTFTLTAAEIAAANLAGQMVVNLDHDSSYDFIAFDWFQLDANPVPVPPTVWLMGSGLLGMIGWRRFRKG